METLKKYTKIVLKQSNGDSYVNAAATANATNQNAFDDLKEIFSNNSVAPVSLNTDVLQPKIAPAATSTKEIEPKNKVTNVSLLTDDLLHDIPTTSSSASDPFDLLKALRTET